MSLRWSPLRVLVPFKIMVISDIKTKIEDMRGKMKTEILYIA